MFQLDEKFLQDIGLNDLPEEQKKPFLQHIYDELELRVGTKLSEGMSDEQLSEFEAIIDHKEEVVTAWLQKYSADYRNDPVFMQLQKVMQVDVEDLNLRSEYAATKWLEINRPDYKSVVSQVLEGIKQEINSNKTSILN
jgi:hypothetical protein